MEGCKLPARVVYPWQEWSLGCGQAPWSWAGINESLWVIVSFLATYPAGSERLLALLGMRRLPVSIVAKAVRVDGCCEEGCLKLLYHLQQDILGITLWGWIGEWCWLGWLEFSDQFLQCPG